ncbi:MAG: NmrA family NAD(P)-binding protein, partial [Alkalispirochaetaceae bacterium]
MGETVLLTGATGNVGAAAARSLSAAGVPVRIMARDPERARAEIEDPRGVCTFTPGSFDGRVPGKELFNGVDRLFLMRPPQIKEVGTLMFPFLQAAREAGVRRVVFLSLLGAQRLPFVPHRKLEKEILRLGFDAAFLRAGFFMQNLDGLFRSFIREERSLPAPAGESRTSFVDARDLGEAAARLLGDHTGRHGAFELTGPESLTYGEVASALSTELGVAVTYPAPSRREFESVALAKGWDQRYVKVVSRLFITVNLGLAAKVTGEPQALLGREPRRI